MRSEELVGSRGGLLLAYFAARAVKYESRHALSQPTVASLLSLPYYSAWLSGFIEAEGCFSTRADGKARSFSIGHKFDSDLLEAVKAYLRTNASVKFRKSEVNFFYLETYNRASLLRLIEHCARYPLIGEKRRQLAFFIACTPSRTGEIG